MRFPLLLGLGDFRRLAHAALFLLTGLALILFVLLFGSRLQVNRQIHAAIEQAVLDNAGLAVEVGSVRGNWWSGLTLADVKVHSGPLKTDPLLGTVPLVQVEYTALSFMSARPRPMRIDAYQPSLGVAVYANRLFSLHPKPKAPHEEKPGDPPPPVDMVFHGGRISYEDQASRKPFRVELGNVTGTGTIRGAQLALDLQALREGDRVNAHVAYDLAGQHGAVQVHGTDLDVGYWANRFAWAREYHVTGGKADLDASLSWHDPLLMEDLQLAGTARVHDGSLDILNVARPLTNVRGEVSFDQHTITLPRIEGEIEGMPVVAHGRVLHFLDPVAALGGPDQAYDLALETPHVELDKLDRLFPGIHDLHLAGLGSITARVSGLASRPHVVMRGLVPAGRYGKEPLTNVAIDADYTPGRFDLPHFAMDLAKGHADGKAFVGIPEQEGARIPYTVDTTFQGVELAEWVSRYRDEPWPFQVSGRLHGDLHLRGLGSQLQTDASVAVANGLMNHEPVQECVATFHGLPSGWTVPAWRLRWGPTAVDGSANGADHAFHVGFKVASGELRQWIHLNPHPPETRITGDASGEGQLGGDPADPNTWTGGARLLVGDGIFDKQPFRDAEATMTLAHNQLAITRATTHSVGGLVRATGTYGPFILRHDEYPTTDLDVAASGMELHAVANLPRSMKAALGRMHGRFSVHIHNRDVVVAGRMQLAKPRLPGWSRLDHATADFRWTPEVARLSPLVVQQGADRYTITGTVGQLDDTYPLDLRIRAPRADVHTLLGTVQWPDVMARLAPQKDRAEAADGPLREVAALASGAQSAQPMPYKKRQRAANELDLAQSLDRWTALRKLPLHRPPAEAPLLPFWQESSGKLWVDAHVTGPILDPSVRLAASAKDLRVFDRTIDSGSLVLGYSHDRLTLPRLRLSENGRTIVTAAGTLSDNPHESLMLRTHGLDLDWTRRALASRNLRLEGHGDLALRVAGPFTSPRAEAVVGLTQGRFTGPNLEPIGFEALDANLAYERGRLAIQRASVKQDGKVATFTGSLPVATTDSSAPVDLAVRLEDGNLAILNLFGQRRFQWLGGKGRVELRLGGTLGQPSLAGQIALHDGSFKASGLDEAVTGLEADVTLNDKRVDVKTLSARYGGGQLDVAGQMLWEQFQPQSLDLSLKAKPFKLSLPNDYYHGWVGADLHVHGPVDQPVLGGQLSLWDGSLDLKETAHKPEAGPNAFPLRMSGLELAIGPRLRIHNSLVDVGVSTQRRGSLVVDGSLLAPHPRGVVAIEDGTIRPLNNPFKIVEGKVEFLGENLGGDDKLLDILGPNQATSASFAAGLNARLDVQARTTVYDYNLNENVNVLTHVTGSLDQIDMHFTSEPLRSEQEILDILSKKQVLEGTFGGKLDRGEVIVKEVGGFVSSNIEELISPYTLFLRNFLNLQTFRVDLISDPSKSSLSDLAGYRPALTLETRPLWERLSFGSRLVMGELYTTTPTLYGDNTYLSANIRLNRYLGLEYRLEPYVDPANDRVLGQVLGLRTQITF